MAMNSEMGLPIIPCLGIVTKKGKINSLITIVQFVVQHLCGWENPQDSCAQLAFGNCLSGSNGGPSSVWVAQSLDQ
jgi:hypothetical protein